MSILFWIILIVPTAFLLYILLCVLIGDIDAADREKRIKEGDPYETNVIEEWNKRYQEKRNDNSSSSTLEYIAKHDSNPEVKVSAIKQMTSESSRSTLEYIAKHDSNPTVRAAAASRLN